MIQAIMSLNHLIETILGVFILVVISVEMGNVVDAVLSEAIASTTGVTATLLEVLAFIIGIPTFVITAINMLFTE